MKRGTDDEQAHFWDLKAALRLETESCWKFTLWEQMSTKMYGYCVHSLTSPLKSFRQWHWVHLWHGWIRRSAVEVGRGRSRRALCSTARSAGWLYQWSCSKRNNSSNLELCLLPVELQLSLPCLQFPSFGVFELSGWGAGSAAPWGSATPWPLGSWIGRKVFGGGLVTLGYSILISQQRHCILPSVSIHTLFTRRWDVTDNAVELHSFQNRIFASA